MFGRNRRSPSTGIVGHLERNTHSRHGVHATQIAAWRKQALEHLSEVFDHGSPVLEDAERHIRDLRAKVGELTMERDFLAGALGRFGLPSAKR